MCLHAQPCCRCKGPQTHMCWLVAVAGAHSCCHFCVTGLCCLCVSAHRLIELVVEQLVAVDFFDNELFPSMLCAVVNRFW